MNWDKILKNRVCQLCGKKTDEKLQAFAGGYLSFAHRSCADIGLKAVELFLRMQLSYCGKRRKKQ